MTNWIPNLRDRNGPTYRVLADCIAEAITTGELKPGDRLPPQRDLAYDLQVTLGTVSRAYGLAANRGLVGGQVGRGTYVLDQSVPSRNAQALHRPAEADAIDMRRNVPPDVGQGVILAAALERVSAGPDFSRLCDYAPHGGDPESREALAHWIGRAGLSPHPDQVVLTIGAQQATFATLLAVVGPGGVVAADELTAVTFKNACVTLNIRIEPIAMDNQGMLPDALTGTLKAHAADAIFVMPCYQNPTAGVMSETRRAEIARVALMHGVPLIEDDVYGFAPGRTQRPIAVHMPQDAFFVTSLSKCTVPGIRVGAIVCPPGQSARITGILHGMMVEAPSILGVLASELIRSGDVERMADAVFTELAERRAVLAECLDPALLTLPPESLHGWLDLPDPWRTADFVAAARAARVYLLGVERFAVARRPSRNGVRVCLGGPRTRADVAVAAEALAGLLARAPAGIEGAV